eukprot:SM000150S01713  [mRNA]  locus=s150:94785:97430:- [translate_table: standard]
MAMGAKEYEWPAPLIVHVSANTEAKRLKNLEYYSFVLQGSPPICFEDVLLLSPPTDGSFVPTPEAVAWLRDRVLRHCGLEQALAESTDAAPQPLRRAVIADRQGTRALANKQELRDMLARVLGVPVELSVSGSGSFCDQVAAVASKQLVLVPHGSQNVNLLFASPHAVVIEVFPFLYHTDALLNYLRATGISYRAVLGAPPPRAARLWLAAALLGWDGCFARRWCKNLARSQHVHAEVHAVEAAVASLVDSCRLQTAASMHRCH